MSTYSKTIVMIKSVVFSIIYNFLNLFDSVHLIHFKPALINIIILITKIILVIAFIVNVSSKNNKIKMIFINRTNIINTSLFVSFLHNFIYLPLVSVFSMSRAPKKSKAPPIFCSSWGFIELNNVVPDTIIIIDIVNKTFFAFLVVNIYFKYSKSNYDSLL